jgi:hypothetical protein
MSTNIIDSKLLLVSLGALIEVPKNVFKKEKYAMFDFLFFYPKPLNLFQILH